MHKMYATPLNCTNNECQGKSTDIPNNGKKLQMKDLSLCTGANNSQTD